MSAERVLFVDHTGQIGGAELILLDVVEGRERSSAFLFEQGPLSKALADKQLTLITSKWGQGLSQFRRDSSWLTALPLAGRLAAIVVEIARASRTHDIVYANSQKAFVLAAIANMLVRRPLIWHLHDIISPEHFGAVQRRVQVALANARATKVIVPSQAAAAAFMAAGGRRDLVEIVPNGLALPPEPRSRSELRKVLGLPAGPLVGVFSRLAPWKGQHVLIEALATLPNVGCIVVGDALFGEQAYAAELKQMVLERGLADRVRFLGHRRDVPTLMKSVDAMVHPSIDPEPFGRTLVEAMLAGVPVIATDAGAAPDILDGGRAGTLVPPNDSQALAKAIASVLAQPDALSGQLEYASGRARARYSVTRMLDAIGLVIRKLQAGATA
ncbi:glycosyltransferase family 4 protein [Bradyrhizobium sp. ARR65]|uniref:glycosyltransferase family 4 protein n=1 Tax=Bradyrhizobium sp. ARR65 TaxID=1040989 RepID=UPI0005558B64|nr:glycosyltransferase family 4 protein [Bradyrhizobium sp. ARR65]